MTTPSQLSAVVKQKALSLGLDHCGIARAEFLHDHEHLMRAWVEAMYHGKMGYMERNFQMRLNPGHLVPGAKSVIMVAQNYYPGQSQPAGSHYKISRYAYGQDYHHILKSKLRELAQALQDATPENQTHRVFIDSAPLLEKAWANRCGLGNTGKNTCLIIPGKGSFFFLGAIVTSLAMDADKPLVKDLCGKCTKCMEACPTGAIVSPGQLDARRCISYLTIELKDPIPQGIRNQCEGWIFGCDICQEVCPHNQKATPHNEARLMALEPIVKWRKEDWENCSEKDFSSAFKKQGSPLARIKHEKLMDNIRASCSQ